jgi:hypothetical protein
MMYLPSGDVMSLHAADQQPLTRGMRQARTIIHDAVAYNDVTAHGRLMTVVRASLNGCYFLYTQRVLEVLFH